MLSGCLHRELEHGERLLEERMATKTGEPTTPAALAGQRGLREENHPASLGDATRKARGAHELLKKVLDRRWHRRALLLGLARRVGAPGPLSPARCPVVNDMDATLVSLLRQQSGIDVVCGGR